MPGIFSGNGSVMWVVEAANVREADSELFAPAPGAPRRVRQTGIDETDRDQEFTVSIKVPQDAREADVFIERLKKQAAALKRGGTLRIALPIEDKRHNQSGKPTRNQIVIEWPSATKTGSARAT
jgi:hypothetical protein